MVAVTGLESQGTTIVRLYLELQTLDAQPYFGEKISFNRDTSLKWSMSDSHGNPVPGWKGPVPWLFDYASITFWISVPGDSMLRFPICSGKYYLLGASRELVFFQGLMNTLPWHLSANRREKYYLSATFKGLEKSNIRSQFIWGSSLSIPPVCLPTDPIPVGLTGIGNPSVDR
jgi:hypothetical protein